MWRPARRARPHAVGPRRPVVVSYCLAKNTSGSARPFGVQEVGHAVAVVAPGEVLVRSVADVGDVVGHVAEGDDGVELRDDQRPRERLGGYALLEKPVPLRELPASTSRVLLGLRW